MQKTLLTATPRARRRYDRRRRVALPAIGVLIAAAVAVSALAAVVSAIALLVVAVYVFLALCVTATGLLRAGAYFGRRCGDRSC